ncbi:MAG: chromate transporter [Lachnospiraceae bacterium]|nr:chromate transporter [Lachnospiraceae bacterium]
MNVYIQLFIEFFQIGLFAVGGGPATIPFLMDLTNRHDWFTKADVANMLAVSESTPGPIGINMATYAGYNAAGFIGGITATLSLVLPSIIVIVIIARILKKFSRNKNVQAAFFLIRPAVTGLIAMAVYEIFNTAMFTDADGKFQFPVTLMLICAGFYILMTRGRLKKLHPFFWILCGALMGIVLKL